MARKDEGAGEGPLVFLSHCGPRELGVWLSGHRAAADSPIEYTQYWIRLCSMELAGNR